MSAVIKPGTYAAKAYAWLKAQPAGTVVKSKALGRAIGMPDSCTTGTSNLRRHIRPLLDAGLVERHGDGVPTRMQGWALSGAALIDPEVAELERDDDPIRTSAPEIQPRPGPFLPGIDVGMGARWITPVSVYAGAA